MKASLTLEQIFRPDNLIPFQAAGIEIGFAVAGERLDLVVKEINGSNRRSP